MTVIKFEEYDFKKLDALSQFHIVRRLAPVIGEIVASLANSSEMKGKDLKNTKFDDLDFNEISKNLAPVFTALAKIPDEDVNYAIFGLLKGVYRKQTNVGGWARITTDTNLFMFEDIKADLKLMMSLAVKSFQVNLSGFMAALPSGLKEGALQSQQIG